MHVEVESDSFKNFVWMWEVGIVSLSLLGKKKEKRRNNNSFKGKPHKITVYYKINIARVWVVYDFIYSLDTKHIKLGYRFVLYVSVSTIYKVIYHLNPCYIYNIYI